MTLVTIALGPAHTSDGDRLHGRLQYLCFWITRAILGRLKHEGATQAPTTNSTGDDDDYYYYYFTLMKLLEEVDTHTERRKHSLKNWFFVSILQIPRSIKATTQTSVSYSHDQITSSITNSLSHYQSLISFAANVARLLLLPLLMFALPLFQISLVGIVLVNSVHIACVAQSRAVRLHNSHQSHVQDSQKSKRMWKLTQLLQLLQSVQSWRLELCEQRTQRV